MFNIENENLQLRLNTYLGNEEWVRALDSFDIERVFELSNVIDYIWLCYMLEAENVKIPSRYSRLKDIKIQHIDINSFKKAYNQSSPEDGPDFEYEVEFQTKAETLKFLHLIYFTDILDDYIEFCDLDIESNITIRDISKATFVVDSYSVDLHNFKEITSYNDIMLTCSIKNQLTTIFIPNKSFYRYRESYYDVDINEFIDVINKFIDELNRW